MSRAPRTRRRLDSDAEVAKWFFENGLDGFVVIRDGRIERVNPRWSQILGWTSAEVVGRDFWEYIWAEDVSRVAEAVRRLPDAPAISCEHRARSARGQPVWIRSRVSAVADGAALVVVQDIARERAEAAMLEQARRSSELMRAAAGVFMWSYDPDTGQYTTDPAFRDSLLGMELGDRSAEVVRRSIHPDDVARVTALWEASLATGEFAVAEYRDFGVDDRWRRVRTAWKGVRQTDAGRWLIEGVTQDITELAEARDAALRSAEAAQAANQAKSAFLATMSHEIRTPLNGVLGMAQAMAADTLSAQQRERLDIIQHSGEALLAILNDVLDLSKIEAGKLEFEATEFDLDELATGAHAAFAAIAARKGLAFHLVIEPNARGAYRGDSTRVRQVLYNLISNAVKFTEEGEVGVRVGREAGELRFAVTDTGVGIAADRMGLLFDKFVQGDASTTRRYGGSGLGLAICHELVHRMGGSIEVESRPGRGSCFMVRLPLPRIAKGRSKPAAVSEASAGEGVSLRVLAAEDNEVNRIVLNTLLRQFGIDPTIVENGRQAFEAWEAGHWDVILMDIQMPELDGPSATRLIRAKEAARGASRTPIIALTANAMAHQVAEYQAVGMDAVVSKPIQVRKLFEALETAVQARDGEAPRAAGLA